MVRGVVQRYQGEIYRMYQEMQPLPVEVAVGGNVSYRYNFPSERGTWACETDVFTMRIGWARNWAGRWKVVLNTEQFPQSVRLEHCKPKDKEHPSTTDSQTLPQMTNVTIPVINSSQLTERDKRRCEHPFSSAERITLSSHNYHVFPNSVVTNVLDSRRSLHTTIN
ncbi:spaetzle domain-containing protein [Trichonephila clavata]|uniref:Spaetzle domain-containing protein n=1 Tax=Trichonephila clavata TaxID=2740835 RepID=A0A8X6L6N4_TRICU|nr:spaetzle domain-containing protein [Trichonephila clavata]